MNNSRNSVRNSRLLFWSKKGLLKSQYLSRQKNILKFLLTCFLVIAVVAQIVAIMHGWMEKSNTGKFEFTLSPAIGFIFFLILLRLTNNNRTKIVAFLFLLVLFLLVFRSSIQGGIDNPQTIVIYSLIIIMSGILISPKFSLISTAVICLSLMTLFGLHKNNAIKFSSDWKNGTFGMSDALVLVSSYMIISVVTWLFSSEIINALKRAKKSEREAVNLAKELQKEKDSLEMKVIKRTNELRESQLREMIRINNLAEFGRISAGLLHDIKNPLTVISLNLDSLRNSPKNKMVELINKSLLAAKTAEKIIKMSQNQITEDEGKQKFDLIQEIKNTLILTAHLSEQEKVQILFDGPKKLVITGYPYKLSRVIVNLVMNAIDSFSETKVGGRKIEIKVITNGTEIIIKVKDNGCGIESIDKASIFEPLFSRKENKNRMGLGLYGSKKIVKDCFGGDIVFESGLGKGSEFSVIIPIR